MLTDTRARTAQNRRDPATPWQRLRDAIGRRRTYKATLRRLRAMPQAELDEMGITRGMISRVAFETAYGRKG